MNNKVLVLEQNENLRAALATVVGFEWNEIPFLPHDEEEAIKIMQEHTDLSLIILTLSARYNQLHFIEELIQQKLQTNIIIFSSYEQDELPIIKPLQDQSLSLHWVMRPKQLDLIPRIIEQLREEAKKEEESPQNKKSYRAFPLENLYELEKTPVNLYLQINKDKFVKILHAKADLRDGELDKLKQKGAIRVFTSKKDHSKLLQAYLSTLQENIKETSRSSQTRHKDFKKLCQLIYGNLEELQLNPMLLESSQKMVSDTFDDLKKSPDILGVMNNLLEKENFHMAHSIALAFIASALCQEGPWSSMVNKKKVTIAALMHDLSLEHFDELKIEQCQLTDIKNSTLSARLKNFLIKHPFHSSHMLQKSGFSDGDTLKIIEQHHERPDGKGYPKGFTASQIFPLATILIVAEHFVMEYFLDVDQPTGAEVYKKIAPLYTEQNFIKVSATLKKILKI